MKLFDPIVINGLQLKNRIVMLPMQLRLGLTNPRAQAYYMARAKGGVGAIVMNGTSVDLFVDDAAWGRQGAVRRFIDKMRKFTDEIKGAGARIGIQLWHGNQLPAGNGAFNPSAGQVAPSATGDQRELTIAEIEAITAKFGQAAEAAKRSGFDFVEVHGAHGYLACQFFSGADNRRTDRYGGDAERRMRFGVETVRAMRDAAGSDYPILYRLGAKEKRPEGITLRQSRTFAMELERAGVDAFDISVGAPVGIRPSPGPRAKMGTYVPLAQSIKRSVSVPVMAVGRINTAEVAEMILSENRADLIGIGRQLIADPDWPNKVKAGGHKSIVACTSCNSCFRPLRSKKWRPGDPICEVNPHAGKELDKISA